MRSARQHRAHFHHRHAALSGCDHAQIDASIKATRPSFAEIPPGRAWLGAGGDAPRSASEAAANTAIRPRNIRKSFPGGPCMQRPPKQPEKGTPARPRANFCRPLDGGSTSHVGSVCGARLARAQPREHALSALQSPAPWVALDTPRAPDEPPTHAHATPRRRN